MMSSDFSDERLKQLETDLRSGPVNLCKEALDALTACSAEQAVPLFLRIAKDGEFLRRRFAVMGLGSHRTVASFQALEALSTEEKDANVLGEIANSLFEIGESIASGSNNPALPILADLFQHHPDWLLRQSVIAILMEGEAYDEMLLPLVQMALEDSEQSVVETGILALGKLLEGDRAPEALIHLTRLTTDPNWRNRWRAATALSRSTDPQAKALLAKLRQDDHHQVVAAALEGNLEN